MTITLTHSRICFCAWAMLSKAQFQRLLLNTLLLSLLFLVSLKVAHGMNLIRAICK